jgi:hypothetical protein
MNFSLKDEKNRNLLVGLFSLLVALWLIMYVVPDIFVNLFDTPLGNLILIGFIILAGMNLKVGKVVYEANDTFPAGTVFKQSCATCEGTSVKPGDLIDLWVVGGEDQ